MDKSKTNKSKTIKSKAIKSKTIKSKAIKSKTNKKGKVIKRSKQQGGAPLLKMDNLPQLSKNKMHLDVPAGAPTGGFGTLVNDFIGLIYSTINTVTGTITTVTDISELSSDMGSVFNDPKTPGA